MENTSSSTKVTPQFFFFSLGVLVSLIVVVASFLNLAFATLNARFPDILTGIYTYGYNTYEYEGMRTAVAMLIIVFPVFLVLSKFWTRMASVALFHANLVIKKWMLYLIVFLSSVIVITDLVTLVNYFVSGEITTRFVLKVLVTLLTALIVGGYYFTLLTNEALEKRIRVYTVLIASFFVVGAIVCAFSVMGSPMKQRQYRMDNRRVSDLQSLQYQVINYWQQKEKLPESLADFRDPISSFMVPVDPEYQKGFVYEYTKTGKMSFELCATFSLPMPKGISEYPSYGIYTDMGVREPAVVSVPFPGGVNDSWDHEEGRTCFSRTIDRDMYPPYPKSVR
jgi:hypothetical protein